MVRIRFLNRQMFLNMILSKRGEKPESHVRFAQAKYFERWIMSNRLEELKSKITGDMTAEEIVAAFEKWYSPMEEEDMLLFETGTFSFTGEPLFSFSLVKQIPNDEDDEYYQIHVDVLYKPDAENKCFSDTLWDETGEEIFDYIRNSDAFQYAKAHKFEKIEVYMDET